MLKLPVRARMRKYRSEDRMRWTRADAELPVRAQKRKYRRKVRMRWTRANAEVVCQSTEAEVQEESQDEMDEILWKGGCM
jgi:hypothetical protein